MIEGLGYVRLEVTDLKRSVRFYRDGLRFAYEGSEEGEVPQAHLRAGELHLVLVEAGAGGADPRGTGVGLSVEVSALDAYHDALVARGLVPSRPLDQAQTRQFSICDPDGYHWTFIQSLA